MFADTLLANHTMNKLRKIPRHTVFQRFILLNKTGRVAALAIKEELIYLNKVVTVQSSVTKAYVK